MGEKKHPGHSKGKSKMTKKELKAQNHHKLMEDRKNKFQPTVIQGGAGGAQAYSADDKKKAA